MGAVSLVFGFGLRLSAKGGAVAARRPQRSPRDPEFQVVGTPGFVSLIIVIRLFKDVQ